MSRGAELLQLNSKVGLPCQASDPPQGPGSHQRVGEASEATTGSTRVSPRVDSSSAPRCTPQSPRGRSDIARKRPSEDHVEPPMS